MGSSDFTVPDAQQQAAIHQLLLTARKVWLSDALRDALEDVDQRQLKSQILDYVPVGAQRILAVAGIRDEAVFPVPVVIETKPSLVAYYRLLLGVSQKRFYTARTGLSRFKRLEEGAALTSALKEQIPPYCKAMCYALGELVLLTNSTLEARDVEDLQLLTLGSFYYGSLNNTIGQTAILGVFTALGELLERYITERGRDWMDITTPNERAFNIKMASDPDLRIAEISDGRERPVVSIEVKGGTDKSNVYNRGGEAEKSHQGATSLGFRVCWTVINMSDIDVEKLKQRSPTTDEWFDTNEVIAQKGPSWNHFQAAVYNALEL